MATNTGTTDPASGTRARVQPGAAPKASVRGALVALGAALGACASGPARAPERPDAGATPPVEVGAAASLPPVVATLGAEGFWFGMSSVSPLGAVPYPLTTARDGDRLVVTVGLRPGLGGADAPFQRFTFAPDATFGSVVTMASGVPGEPAATTLVERSRDATTTRYCLTDASGGCAAIALTLSGSGTSLELATEVHGRLHHQVWLSTAVP